MQQLELIRVAGEKAGRARRDRDEARARFESDWAQRAIALEDDPEAARQAFREGYSRGAAR